MKNKIKNTTKNPNPEWLLGGNPKAIEAQEEQGQQELVNSDVLPIEWPFSEEKAILEQYGVIFKEVIPEDDLFQYVILPDGWGKKSTNHPMWSNLLDNKGRIRARIYYKAAFYDRDAFIQLNKRFHISFDFDKLKKNIFQNYIADTSIEEEKIIYRTTEVICQKDDFDKRKLLEKQSMAECKSWLDKNYPDWNDPIKSWDYVI